MKNLDNSRTMKLAVLGSTGSIGKQTLSVARSHPDKFEVVAVTAASNTELLFEQCREFMPKYAALHDTVKAHKLREDLAAAGLSTELLEGASAPEKIAGLGDVDAVVIGITGMQAIFPLLQAMRSGKRVALANKESIVCGGEFVSKLLKGTNGKLFPVDSEQSAIFQCMQGLGEHDVFRLVLTASGGPFREWTAEQIRGATLEQALKHPNWSMGKKITIDSATLANKGLEVIEAAYLFDVKADDIDVLIHPQSIVHSFVETRDGALLAQLGSADMRLPIQYALTHPNRCECEAPRLTAAQMRNLEFFEPDMERFRALKYAYDALRAGGTAPAIYNAANEQAVEHFLQGSIPFWRIPELIGGALEAFEIKAPQDLEEILEIDARAREYVRGAID